MAIQIEVNNTVIEAIEGETILMALRRNGFKVPTLCYMSSYSPTGACRLCVVEVEGKKDLITSCSYPVEDGLKIKTNSQAVIRARKTIVELLLANHPDDCLYCVRNGSCELQYLAEELHIRDRKFYSKKNPYRPDHSSSSVFRDPAKCVLCSRCVRVCEETQLVNAVDFISKAGQTKVNSAYNRGLNTSTCIHCGQCILVCPTGALVEISHSERVQAAIDNPDITVVVTIGSSVAVSIAAELGLKTNTDYRSTLNAALLKMGFAFVFDTGFATDLNIIEEARELQNRIGQNSKMPLFSSCCPSWVKYCEDYHPELLTHLSPLKSPQQIMGTILTSRLPDMLGKEMEKLFVVSIEPCVAKKYEASREELTQKGFSDVDAVLTVRELLRMFRMHGIDMKKTEPIMMGEIFTSSSALSSMTGYSGGKTEAVFYALNSLMNGKKHNNIKFPTTRLTNNRREVKLEMGKKEIGFVAVSSISEIENLIKEISQNPNHGIHYVEVMACVGGCVNGGGQPLSYEQHMSKTRKKLLVEQEKTINFYLPNENQELGDFVKTYTGMEDEQALKSIYLHIQK